MRYAEIISFRAAIRHIKFTTDNQDTSSILHVMLH